MAKYFSITKHLYKNQLIFRSIYTSRLLNGKKNLIDFMYDLKTDEICIKTSYHITISFGLNIQKNKVHFFFSGNKKLPPVDISDKSKEFFILNDIDMKAEYDKRKKSGDIDFNECLIETGPMSLLDIDTNNIISMLNYSVNSLKIRSLSDIQIRRACCDFGSIETVNGNIMIGIINAGFLGMRANNHGNIDINILTGQDANVCTYYGYIHTQFSKYTRSNFLTHYGDIYLKNVHRNCNVKILNNGTLRMTAISGQFDAYVNSGNVFIHITGVLRESTLTVNDTKDCQIYIGDFFFYYGSIHIKSNKIFLIDDELVKHGKFLEANKVYEVGRENTDNTVKVNVNGNVILGVCSMPEVYLKKFMNIN